MSDDIAHTVAYLTRLAEEVEFMAADFATQHTAAGDRASEITGNRARILRTAIEQLGDARRWRAFLAIDRIRVLGFARDGQPTMHFGAEFWIAHPRHDPEQHAGARNLLTTFADAAIAAGKG